MEYSLYSVLFREQKRQWKGSKKKKSDLYDVGILNISEHPEESSFMKQTLHDFCFNRNKRTGKKNKETTPSPCITKKESLCLVFPTKVVPPCLYEGHDLAGCITFFYQLKPKGYLKQQ